MQWWPRWRLGTTVFSCMLSTRRETRYAGHACNRLEYYKTGGVIRVTAWNITKQEELYMNSPEHDSILWIIMATTKLTLV